jgi:hypothetical protein
MDSHIARQIGFVNTSVWAQEIAQSCPTAFVRVDMYFSYAVSIIIACPFILSMTHGVAYALQAIVAVVFIGVECSFSLSKAFYKRAECLALRVLHDTNTHLAGFSANHGTDGWTIILVGAPSTPFVRSTTRWILWITMPFSFFPQRSGTFRRFRLPDRSRVRSFVRTRHWLATDVELPWPLCG